MTDFDKKYITIIKEIVLSCINPKEHTVFLFGSRAMNKSQKISDVDIGIQGKKPLGDIYYKIINKIEESIVPYKVDIVDFSLVDEKFKKTALKKVEIWNHSIH